MTDRLIGEPKWVAGRPVYLHVFKGDCDWIVGAGLEDALLAYEEFLGGRLDEHDRASDAWEQLDDETQLTLVDDLALPKDQRTRTTKSCSAWAYENGRGLLASTEF